MHVAISIIRNTAARIIQFEQMYEENSFINLSILKIKEESELIFNGNQALQVEGMLVFLGFHL